MWNLATHPIDIRYFNIMNYHSGRLDSDFPKPWFQASGGQGSVASFKPFFLGDGHWPTNQGTLLSIPAKNTNRKKCYLKIQGGFIWIHWFYPTSRKFTSSPNSSNPGFLVISTTVTSPKLVEYLYCSATTFVWCLSLPTMRNIWKIMRTPACPTGCAQTCCDFTTNWWQFKEGLANFPVNHNHWLTSNEVISGWFQINQHSIDFATWGRDQFYPDSWSIIVKIWGEI